MDILIKPKKLKGKLNIISSKSFAHRAIICAALCEGESVLRNINFCDDVNATINSLREIVYIKKDGKDLIIRGGIKQFSKTNFFVNNSGSSLRFLLPTLSFFNKKESNFILGDSLSKRPFSDYEKLYTQTKCRYEKKEDLIKTKGFPDENVYVISTEYSSQFVSGLLFLAPNLAHDTTINIKGNIKSAKYIEQTIYIMKQFGIEIKMNGNNIFVIGNQKYKPTSIAIPSDLSFLTNCMIMNRLGSEIEFEDLLVDSKDPDYSFIQALQSEDKEDIDHLDFETNTDIVPPFSVLASLLSTKTIKFTGVERLQYKESNRLFTIAENINSLGGQISFGTNTMTILPVDFLNGGVVDSYNDHRIAFMGVLLSTVAKGDIIIKNFDCVSKSYPDFLGDFFGLGLDFEIIRQQEVLSFKIADKKTEVIIGQKLLSSVDKYFSFFENRRLIVADKNVPKTEVKKLSDLLAADVYYLDDEKEKVKTIENAQKIIDYLIDKSFSKSDEIIAFGGGTVTDLVGFVSMIYKRGISYVNIPTTLLSQVDASIGGKVAVNEAQVKNAVGGFYPPRLVLIDPNLLNTLPEIEFRSGMAEIIKIAAISDPILFYDILDRRPYENLVEWIIKAIKDKIAFIEKDPFDEKERRALNFGHTYGHALESKTPSLSHGEAVAKGMHLVSSNASLDNCLTKYGFYLSCPIKKSELMPYIINDKKVKNGELTLVELEEIGKYRFRTVKIQ